MAIKELQIENSRIMAASLDYQQLGWAVLPLHSIKDGKCSCGKSNCSSPGKHPRTLNGVKDASTDPIKIQSWFERWPDFNIGLATGATSGFIVIDIDLKYNGPDTLIQLEEDLGKLPKTVKQMTGGGGQHLFFKYPQEKIGNKAGVAPGIDIRGDDGYIVAPPSSHASGKSYEWDLCCRPDKALLADLPENWRKFIQQGNKISPVNAPLKIVDQIPEGYRNDYIFRLASSLKEKGLDREAILAAVKATNLKRCNPPLDDGEIGRICHSVERYEPSNFKSAAIVSQANTPSAGEKNATDLGNAQRLIELHGEDLRYCHDWKKWLIWDGLRWMKDDTGEIQRKAVKTVQAIYAEANSSGDENARKNLARHAISSESHQRIKAMVELATSLPGVPVTPDQLDNDQWLLNTQNGTIDLKTGMLREHVRSDLITKIVAVGYDPEAVAPKWNAFLNRIMAGDMDLMHYLQKAVGYSLTGDTSEQIMFILFGSGANGKSTFLEVISALLGNDFAQQTPTSTLMVKHGDSIPNDIARLKGARFVISVEAEAGQRMAESLIKQVTGGDQITARFMRAEYFSFKPEFKLFFATNHRPDIKGTDEAIWRRIRSIPFKVTIPAEERDKQLQLKLKQELPGILAWAVQGCLDWQKEGIKTPGAVKEETSSYRSDMDVMASFLDECCIRDINLKSSSGILYDAYCKWCDTNREGAIKHTLFGRQLAERGLKQGRGTNGTRLWEGIGIKGTT